MESHSKAKKKKKRIVTSYAIQISVKSVNYSCPKFEDWLRLLATSNQSKSCVVYSIIRKDHKTANVKVLSKLICQNLHNVASFYTDNIQ